MAELQDRYKRWVDREGLVEVGHIPMMHAQKAVVRSLFTMDRAVELFDRKREPLKHLGGSWGGFTARNVNGDQWAWAVVRVWK